MCNGVSFSVVAESVLHKEGHMLDGVKLRVKEQVQRRNVTQPKFYKNKVFVSLVIPSTMTEATVITLYLHEERIISTVTYLQFTSLLITNIIFICIVYMFIE